MARLLALVAVASLAALLTGAAVAQRGVARDEPTKQLVEPVWEGVVSAHTRFTLVRRNLVAAATSKGGWRLGDRELAVEDLGRARSALETAAKELSPILDSPFVHKTLDTVGGLEERIERSIKAAKGPRDALDATRDLLVSAEAQLERLTTYLDLTVVQIRATFVFPVTTYDASIYLAGHLPGGVRMTWSNSNDCGDFRGGVPNHLARWSHPDSRAPGACPPQAVHPGTITVVASFEEFTCTGTYPLGSAAGIEQSPAREPCTVRK